MRHDPPVRLCIRLSASPPVHRRGDRGPDLFGEERGGGVPGADADGARWFADTSPLARLTGDDLKLD